MIEQDASHAVCTDILNHSLESVFKYYNLTIHGMVNSVYGCNSVTYRNNRSHFLVLADLIIIFYFFF